VIFAKERSIAEASLAFMPCLVPQHAIFLVLDVTGPQVIMK